MGIPMQGLGVRSNLYNVGLFGCVSCSTFSKFTQPSRYSPHHSEIEMLIHCTLATETTMPSLPDLPEMPKGIRPATPSDILRMGIILTAAFFHTSIFTWNRPNHHLYPQDTLLHYRHQISSHLRNPRCIVLVATDLYEPDENEKPIGKSKATIPSPSSDSWNPPAKGTEVVVGVLCITLEKGSKREGKFGPVPGQTNDFVA